MSAQLKFYWYKSGGFTLAVDAVSSQDARNYVKSWHPGREFKYLGHHGCPGRSQNVTACCGTTAKRQEEIHNSFMDWLND